MQIVPARKEEKKQGGYFTLEATVIVFLTCILVLGVLLVSLYFYDLGCAKGLLNQRMAELSMRRDTEKQAEAEKMRKEIKAAMIISRLKELSLEENELYLLGEARIFMKIPVPIIGAWIGELWENEISIKIERGNNTDRMRRWDILE